ncbi:MAG: hypothetical protein ACK5PS_19470 [Desulfopila sp.]
MKVLKTIFAYILLSLFSSTSFADVDFDVLSELILNQAPAYIINKEGEFSARYRLVPVRTLGQKDPFIVPVSEGFLIEVVKSNQAYEVSSAYKRITESRGVNFISKSLPLSSDAGYMVFKFLYGKDVPGEFVNRVIELLETHLTITSTQTGKTKRLFVLSLSLDNCTKRRLVLPASDV